MSASGWDENRRQQILHLARTTTPAQRLAWLDGLLAALGDRLPELLRNRDQVNAATAPPPAAAPDRP
ncbi:MAG TPA: hypothetical protein VK324_03460 [Tepidisphaeraceae bacterium]|nr:hypothetical protein [Tepidisphaeraceae bacterium]